MKIKEVEKRLGVSRATVRFYEKNGLLNPKRTTNFYRDYSDEDIAELRRVIMLRKLGISVEDIRDLQDGSVSLSDILDENITKISAQLEELSGALAMCRRMKQQEATMEALYSPEYWDLLKKEEAAGHSFVRLSEDMIKYGKHIFLSSFEMEDCEGGSLYGVGAGIAHILVECLLVGGICCLIQYLLFQETWSWENFWKGFWRPFAVMLITFCVELPEFLIGRKWPQKKATVQKIRKIIFGILALLFVLFLIFVFILWIAQLH